MRRGACLETGETNGQQILLLFLTTKQIEKAVSCVVSVIEGAPVLGSDLRKAVVAAVETEEGCAVVYPPGYEGAFTAYPCRVNPEAGRPE